MDIDGETASVPMGAPAGRAYAPKTMRRRHLQEKAIEYALAVFTVMSSILIFFIMFFVITRAVPVLKASGLGFIFHGGWNAQFIAAWQAQADQPQWVFGALPLIMGTIYTTLGALLIAVPLGLGCAIFLVELCPSWLRSPLTATVRLLAAIPSVIYGLVGMIVVVPLIAHTLITNRMAMSMINIAALDGSSILAGMIVLSIMIGPIFIALSSDALRAVPGAYREAAFSLGISHWRTIIKVMVPAARQGIFAGAILATGRAIGEAIALSMVSGGVASLPDLHHGLVFFLEPVSTLASAIVNNSEGMLLPTCQSALFACATLLLFASVALSIMARIVVGVTRGGGRRNV
jgi:phosphate transport system permease protein